MASHLSDQDRVTSDKAILRQAFEAAPRDRGPFLALPSTISIDSLALKTQAQYVMSELRPEEISAMELNQARFFYRVARMEKNKEILYGHEKLILLQKRILEIIVLHHIGVDDPTLLIVPPNLKQIKVRSGHPHLLGTSERLLCEVELELDARGGSSHLSFFRLTEILQRVLQNAIAEEFQDIPPGLIDVYSTHPGVFRIGKDVPQIDIVSRAVNS